MTDEEEKSLYAIDPEAAAVTKMLRQYIGASYAQALQLMAEYAALPTDKTEQWKQDKLI